ncbi:MAG: hypothetical protein V4603_03650 [Pseudomonadota bacterium]
MLATISAITILAIIVALALATLAGRNGPVPASIPLPGVASVLPLMAIAIFLLLVGLVSNTLKTHLVQIAPMLLALALYWRFPRLGVLAATPLYLFWLAVMAAIWLFLLGIARFVSGTFSPAEIVLTVLIALAALGGLAYGMKLIGGIPVGARAGVVIGFGALQCIALIVSYLPVVTG